MSTLLPVGSPELLECLGAHAVRLKALSPTALYGAGQGRQASYSLEVEGLLVDYSRQLIDESVWRELLELGAQANVPAAVRAMYTGVPINHTEQRPALHVALRDRGGGPLQVGDTDVRELVHAERAKLAAFVLAVRGGARRGASGERFTDVVNVGIGGSDLGPVMAVEALKDYAEPGVAVHFVSNIDGTEAVDLIARLNPATTLVLICSKTFTTLETLTNARRMRGWIATAMGEDNVAAHFAAVSTNHPAMDAFGVAADARFTMWDWVGGRYSLWSAVGLAVELAIGTAHFESLLDGANAIDRHFANTEGAANLPLVLALLSVWNGNFLGCHSHAVLPYAQRLHRLPAYLQQLTMESNGKSVARDGQQVSWHTGTVIWGEPGSNGQHSFFELLHQGTHRIAADFLLPYEGPTGELADSILTASNALAQANALARGRTLEQVLADPKVKAAGAAGVALAPHRVHPGGRPSTVIAFERLDPATLGKLIALYEHRVYVESLLWGINPFDQWGVELGKVQAEALVPVLQAVPTGQGAMRWLHAALQATGLG